jgi:GR25 family glycosyltransferase involved in LPS biosynthesis
MSNFFEFFDKVYCINLKHREDRKISILNQCSKYKLGKINFFEAVNGNNHSNKYNLLSGAIGLIMSNIEILKEAKEKNYEKILILEDDCYFTDEIQNINEYLDLIPSDWDMFYLGGNHQSGTQGVKPPLIINDKIIKLNNTLTTHFVAIKNKMFDVILDRISTFENPIDVIYTQLQRNYNVYCSCISIAKQINGYSDIENKIVDYHWLIK